MIEIGPNLKEILEVGIVCYLGALVFNIIVEILHIATDY